MKRTLTALTLAASVLVAGCSQTADLEATVTTAEPIVVIVQETTTTTTEPEYETTRRPPVDVPTTVPAPITVDDKYLEEVNAAQAASGDINVVSYVERMYGGRVAWTDDDDLDLGYYLCQTFDGFGAVAGLEHRLNQKALDLYYIKKYHLIEGYQRGYVQYAEIASTWLCPEYEYDLEDFADSYLFYEDTTNDF